LSDFPGPLLFDLSTHVSARVLQEQLSARRDENWVDPLVGLRCRKPIGDKRTFDLRRDTGGCGVGSDPKLNGWGTLVRQNSESFSW
jgi:hypothetical protein